MSFVRYPHIIDEHLLRNMLIVHKETLATAARKLKVPYNCLRNQAEQLLTEEEYEAVIYYRDRVTFTREFKVKVMREARVRERELMEGEDPNVQRSRARGKAYKEIASKYGLNHNLLYLWRNAFIKALQKPKKQVVESRSKSK